MLDREPTLGLPIKDETKNDAIYAAAHAKLYDLMMQPASTPAERILANTKINHLLRLLLVAPDDMIASC